MDDGVVGRAGDGGGRWSVISLNTARARVSSFHMKHVRKPLVLVVIGFTGLLFSAGCVSQVARSEMTRRNEAEFKKGKIPPAQYRQQRDEIDRNLK